MHRLRCRGDWPKSHSGWPPRCICRISPVPSGWIAGRFNTRRGLLLFNALPLAGLAVLLIPSVFSQVIGAFYYPNGSWDADPNVDANNWRLWDWSDTQMKRSFEAGPVIPPLLASTGRHIISAL